MMAPIGRVVSLVMFTATVTLGCAQERGGEAAAEAELSSVRTTSATLFQAFSSLSVSEATVRATSIDKVYQDALATSTDASFQVADLGLTWTGTHTQLERDSDLFAALSSRYATLGGLIDAGLISAPRTSTLAMFQTQLRGLHAMFEVKATAADLALASYQEKPSFYVGKTGVVCQSRIYNDGSALHTYTSQRTGETLGYYDDSIDAGKLINSSNKQVGAAGLPQMSHNVAVSALRATAKLDSSGPTTATFSFCAD